jgi:hypothetical protein
VQYVHVVTRPASQNMVRIRDNGYRVSEVTNLRTGGQLSFNQSGGYLTILGIDGWDSYDTVFRVVTRGQESYYPQSSIRASASASRDGHAAGNLVDGSFLDYWDSAATLPVSVTLDLGERRDAAYLAVNQREWSPTYSRSTFGRPEDSARIKNYRVFVSDDGLGWGDPVRSGIMPSRRGVQFIDIGQQQARYVKLEVLSTWAGPQAPRFVKELRIDEIKVGHVYPYSPRNPLPHEAEATENVRQGTAAITRCPACSGGAKVGGLGNGPGNAVTVTGVQVDKSGDYRLDIDYTADRDRPLEVSLNGADPVQVNAAGDNPDVVAGTSIAVPLRAGANTVTLSSTAAVGPAIDRISVRALPAASYVPLTMLDVQPARTYVPPGMQSVEVTGLFRDDDVDPVDAVTMAPVVPAGWSVEGAPVTASRLSHGETLDATWIITTPSTNDRGAAADIPVKVSFGMFGRSYTRQRSAHVEVLPADRVFMREAESFQNTLGGDAGRTGCARCSGGEKVRNIGGDPANYVSFDKVAVDQTRDYTLFIEYTLNGTRSFFVGVNGGNPVEVSVSSSDPNAVGTTSVTVPLRAGNNTITFGNDDTSAPDLDRIGLG